MMMGSLIGEMKCKGRNEGYGVKGKWVRGRKFWKAREDGKTSGSMLRLKSGPNLEVTTYEVLDK